jgi:hypothetical protein
MCGFIILLCCFVCQQTYLSAWRSIHMAIISVRQNQNWCATLLILAGMNSLLLKWRGHRICVSSCMKKVRIVLYFEPNSHRRYVTVYRVLVPVCTLHTSRVILENLIVAVMAETWWFTDFFLGSLHCSELETKLVAFNSCVMYNIQTTVKLNPSFMKGLWGWGWWGRKIKENLSYGTALNVSQTWEKSKKNENYTVFT